MPCYHPWTAYRRLDGGMSFKNDGRGDPIQLPCGRCIGCRLERSRQWAVRMMCESQMHDVSSFVTLTYDEANLPSDLSVSKRHLQLFFKRLRKAGYSFRYYACGEYGEDYSRPHYHLCLFGVNFADDRVFYRNGGKSGKLYTSASLEAIWGFGFCVIGDLTFESAAYVSRYCTKVINGDLAESHYTRVCPDTGELFRLEPEFSLMSRRPGIGDSWIRKFHPDVYAAGDGVISRGRSTKPPRFFDRIYRRVIDNGYRMDEIDCERYLDGLSRSVDNTDARLEAREIVTKAAFDLKRRS